MFLMKSSTHRVAADFAQLHGQVLQLRRILGGRASQQRPNLHPQSLSVQLTQQASFIPGMHGTGDMLATGTMEDVDGSARSITILKHLLRAQEQRGTSMAELTLQQLRMQSQLQI